MSEPVWQIQEHMLQQVAQALGPELCRGMAFVGGCTTALMLTDAASREEVRLTEDVDLIVHVLTRGGWYMLEDSLRQRGFRSSLDEEVICRMRLPTGDRQLIVDFMPDDPAILNFGNRWYADALRTAIDRPLPDGTVIRVVAPVYFLATKLEAFRGRGNNDLLGSRDMDDILTVINGREELAAEMAQADPVLRTHMAAEIGELLQNPDMEYAVQSTVHGNRQREELLFQRLEALARL